MAVSKLDNQIQDQLNDLNSKIAKEQTILDTTASIGTSYSDTGKTFTLSQPSVVRITQGYNGGRPKSIGCKLTNSSSGASQAFNSVDMSDTSLNDSGEIGVTALLSTGTYHIWASAKTSGTNTLRVYAMSWT